MTPSILNDAQEYVKVGKDVSCNLGSINIPNFMNQDPENVEKSVETMVRSLTYVSDQSSVGVVPTVQKGNAESHAIGLGAMGLHTMFATHHMMYGSKASLEFTDKFFEMINYLTLKASNKIAKERKVSFIGFKDSDYADGSYFDKYVDKELEYKNPAVEELFRGFPVPTAEDWQQLKADVMAYGLYNQNRMAMAPNGSISYVNETSSSLHPITSLVENRQEGKTGSTFYPAPKLATDNMKYYKIAYDTSMIDVINIYATAQKHVDQGMSLTMFMRSEIPAGMYPWKPQGGKMSTKDLTLLRHYAWKKGIKSIYYVRTFTSDDQQIGIDECESCTV